jgi:colicin import membrane protein
MLLHNKGHRNFTSIEVGENKFETLVAGGSLDVPDELAKKLAKAYPSELTTGDYSKAKAANTVDVEKLKIDLGKANEQLASTQAEADKAKAELEAKLKAAADEKAELEAKLKATSDELTATKAALEKFNAAGNAKTDSKTGAANANNAGKENKAKN